MQARQELRTAGLTLVTGGTGFVGSHLVEELISTGHRVRCIVRPGRRGEGWLAGLPVEFVEADLFDDASLDRALAGATAVIHAAGVTKARREAEYVRGNVETTRRMLTAAARQGTVGHFCYVSSQTAVGPSTDGSALTEDAACVPLTAYGRSKLQAERLCLAAQDQLPISVVRPSAVYGPRDRDILEMFRWAGFGVRPLIGSKDKTISLIHVKDLARGISSVALSPDTIGKTYFITDPLPYAFHSVVDMLATIVHRRPVPVRFPVPVLFAVAAVVEAVSLIGPRPAVLSIDKARDMVQPYWACSGERIARDLGFRPTLSLEEGLRTTYEWYRRNKWL